MFVCWLVALRPSNMRVYLRDGSAQTILRAATTETEVADQSFNLTQSQHTDTGPTSPSADPITPGAWQGSQWSAKCLSHRYDSTPEKSPRKRGSTPGSSALEADALTTRHTRRSNVSEIPPLWQIIRYVRQCDFFFSGSNK